jgi:ComF family protein
MIKSLQRIYYALSSLIAPSFCEWCKTFLDEPSVYCDSCSQLIKPVVSKYIQVTPTILMPVYALGLYREPLKSLILSKSYSNRLAAQQLGSLLWQHSTISFAQFDAIVPVPLHWARFAYRGYNQAEVIAQQLSIMSKKPCINLVKRSKRTPFLSSIKVEQRFEMVKSAFEVIDPECIKDRHILIVDDVMTTGATLIAVAKKIVRHKPASIKAVVAARTR